MNINKDNKELIGVITPSLGTIKTGISIGIAARELFKLGRTQWAKSKADIPKDKKWLVEIQTTGGSDYTGFWSLMKSSGFANLLPSIEKKTGRVANVVIVPNNGAIDTYIKRLVGPNANLNNLLISAAKAGKANDDKKDIVTELLATHFFHFPFEGATCIQIPAAVPSGSEKKDRQIVLCGRQSVTSIRVPDSKIFLDIKKSILRGPDAKKKIDLGSGPTKLITAVVKRKARKQKGNTWIFFVTFSIVPPTRLNVFKPDLFVSTGKKRVKVKKSTKKIVRKERRKSDTIPISQNCCWYCSSEKCKLKRCNGCFNACYCSVECQTKDWVLHRRECPRDDLIT